MRAVRCFLLWLCATAACAQVAVLEDFETKGAARWTGNVQASSQRATHGKNSGRIVFESARTEASLEGFAPDWRGFDRLLFDIYSDRERPHSVSLRIHEDTGGGAPALENYFEASDKAAVLKGWNHIEVRLPLSAASFGRQLSLDRIAKIVLSAGSATLPWTVYADNFRLVKGKEGAGTASRMEPQESVTSIENRWFTVRQVAAPEEVPESQDVKGLRAQAVQEAERLREIIRTAQLQGIDTIYFERHLVTADLGLHLRPRLPWFNDDVHKAELFRYVAASCGSARRDLAELVGGGVYLPQRDDTQAGEPLVPPYPALKGRPAKDRFFVDDRGRPMFIISLHSPSRVLERFFASPLQHIESYTVGGGSRWTIDESPVYEVFQKYPDARRVGWDGWCGHLVRDLDSMGGTKKDNTVICLESPQIREAIDKYIRAEIPRFHENPQLLYNIMAYELSYMCYCDRSQRMFREWLGKKHGTIARVNAIYGASYRGFEEVSAPPVKNARPLPETNRALWYDWARFNMDRFTDHLLWVKSRIRAADPRVPLAAGGSSYMLSGSAGTSGIDEERIVNEVDDVIIHEGAGSPLGMDLQLAFSETAKPLADPEMALESVHDLLPHALHGKSVMQFYHWPAQPQNEYFHLNEMAFAHSWDYSLADVSELIRATLDARRLSSEISAFAGAPAEVAILYSQTSTLQLPPETLTSSATPYLAELQKAYEASRYLDAKVTFVTERQILKGRLERYKLLIVPGARNVPAGVVEKIWSYVSAGGRVLIVPESLLADEYNRPQRLLVPAPPLRHREGEAGVARTPLGRGVVYYAAASLEERRYAGALDRLFEEAGITRPVRVRGVDPEVWRIEARLARNQSRALLYIINSEGRAARLRLEGPYRTLEDLREGRGGTVSDIMLGPRQTGLYELR